jgi:hypothetical protein
MNGLGLWRFNTRIGPCIGTERNTNIPLGWLKFGPCFYCG